MSWSTVVGPVAAIAFALLAAAWLVTTTRRELQGPAPRQASLATSSPGWSMALVAVVLVAAVLLVLRLGYLS